MARLDPTANAIELPCGGCGAINRVPLRRLDQRPVCGSCKQALATERPVEVTDRDFGTLIRESALPVLVDFWAPWCGPCKMVAPELEKVASERRGQLLVAKLNSDDNPATSTTYNIRSIPTLLLFDRGQEKRRLSGAMSAAQILSQI